MKQVKFKVNLYKVFYEILIKELDLEIYPLPRPHFVGINRVCFCI